MKRLKVNMNSISFCMNIMDFLNYLTIYFAYMCIIYNNSGLEFEFDVNTNMC